MTADLVKRPDLGQLVASAASYGKATITDETRRRHECEFAKFSKWCSEYGLPSMPADPGTVCLYLAALADGSVRTDWIDRYGEPRSQMKPLKVGTIEHAYGGIIQAHRSRGHEWPVAHVGINKVLKGIRVKLGTRKRRAAPMEIGDLTKAIASLRDRRFDDLVTCRDRSILALGFWGAFRRSEIVELLISDLEFVREGLVVHVRKSKGDQTGAGEDVAIPFAKDPKVCAVLLTQEWIKRAELKDGPLYRRIDPRSDAIGAKAMWSDVVHDLVKRVAEATGLDPDKFSGHSLRSGFATSAARAGKTLHNIMRQTRHKDSRVAMTYIRHGSLFTGNAAEGLEAEEEKK
jgi:integrase